MPCDRAQVEGLFIGEKYGKREGGKRRDRPLGTGVAPAEDVYPKVRPVQTPEILTDGNMNY